jgi:bifunctional non-homologous end joining protein LigD
MRSSSTATAWQIYKSGPKVRLFSRNGNEWTDRMPHLVEAMTSLAFSSATIDAEFVASDDKAIADFAGPCTS